MGKIVQPTAPIHARSSCATTISQISALDRRLSEEETIGALVGDSPISIYNQLTTYLRIPGASLVPGTKINALLTSLVALLQRGAHSAATQILKDPVLRARGGKIQDVANISEDLLERHYASVLASSPLPDVQSERKMSRVSKMALATEPFPYVANYVRMMRAECVVLECCIRLARNSRVARQIRFAMCGSGPMPLSGGLACAMLNAEVTLIDLDSGACALAEHVVSRWEAVGAIQRGAISNICLDAADVQWGGRGLNAVECDAVLVASLVPDAVKIEIAKAVAMGGENGPHVFAVRSAHGLTEVANYNAAPRSQISDFLDFVGYVVPRGHLEEGKVRGENTPPMAVIPGDVLNSLEIFARKSENTSLARHMREEVLRIPTGKGGTETRTYMEKTVT